MSAATYPLLKRKNLLNQSIVNWITYDCICAYEHCTRNSTTVEPLYRGHHWDPSGCPVYSGTSLYRTPLGPIWLSCIQWTSLYRTPLGPIWLSCIQWNLSIQNTTGTQLVVLYTVEPLYTGHHWTHLAVLYRGVPSSEVGFVHSSMQFGLQTVSSIERCCLFRVSFIERFHCTLCRWSGLPAIRLWKVVSSDKSIH